MPQMMPMLWIFLFFFLLIIFTFLIYLIYYIFNPTVNSLNYFKTNFKNWSWKW
uniref:ATP synthase complex subunit 8 n=1 Tax=Ectomomyrmex javanus TaxID=2571052 RepID=A0A4D6P2C1_9HYME|nr:ATP synthase F0 subunit 8 [Ectomomyrmex javanus]QCE31825.1 ATP synthase F0 subunit 8 [Ectomomyrmex javanus]